jgi:hypothetical protein
MFSGTATPTQEKLSSFTHAMSCLPFEREEAEQGLRMNESGLLQSLMDHFALTLPGSASSAQDQHSHNHHQYTHSADNIISRIDIDDSTDSLGCFVLPASSVHPDWDPASLHFLTQFRDTYLACREKLIRVFLDDWNAHRDEFVRQNSVLFSSVSLQELDESMRQRLRFHLCRLQIQALGQLKEDLGKLFDATQQPRRSIE